MRNDGIMMEDDVLVEGDTPMEDDVLEVAAPRGHI